MAVFIGLECSDYARENKGANAKAAMDFVVEKDLKLVGGLSFFERLKQCVFCPRQISNFRRNLERQFSLEVPYIQLSENEGYTSCHSTRAPADLFPDICINVADMPHLVVRGRKARPLCFMGSARRDLRKFPEAVRNSIGLDLYAVQCGMTPDAAKPFKGLKGVMEIVERYATDTYRALYVTTLDDTVYVLHCFKKKSKRGVKTPQADIDVVTQRYKQARVLARQTTRDKADDKNG